MPNNDAAPQTLRDFADRRNLHIGVAVGAAFWSEPSPYREVLARDFNMLVPENEMKLLLIHPERERYNFLRADELVQFAEEHKMRVRGHTLVWHRMQPRWLNANPFSRDELIEILREHIHTVVGRYRGRIAQWDVVNEAIDDAGGLRKDLWLDAIGPDYIDMAFRFAHEADPDALLFYNDYGAEGMGPKANEVYDLVRAMQARGVPIHGVGLQCHLRDMDHKDDIRLNIERLAALGLRIAITETDFALKMPPAPADYARQADNYRNLLEIALDNPKACDTFMLWGLTDRHSWIPGEEKGYGAPLIFDGEYQPKPAYDALAMALADHDQPK